MKNKILYIIIFFNVLNFKTNAQRRNNDRYLKPFEVKSSVAPAFRFSQRHFKYAFNEISVPLTSKKINLVLDNSRQNGNFDLVSRIQARAYALSFAYSAGAGLFDKHIILKLLKAKNGDFTEVVKNTSFNHTVEAGINYLGIRQLFKKVENTDFQFNASANYVFCIDFSDRFDMSEYINLFEYQNLPEAVLRNKKSFEQVQSFIISKYSLPNSPIYKGFSVNAQFQYLNFSLFSNYYWMKNKINSRVNSFMLGGRYTF